MQTLFRDRPSAALKVFLLAAVVSYAGVAATHVEGCFPHNGECLLLTPAVLVYWAPAFVVAWIVLAVLVKTASPRQRVLPAVRLDNEREPAYSRLKAEGGFSAAIGGFACIGLQAVIGVMRARTSGAVHDAAMTVDHFLHTRLGVGLVMAVFGLAAYWALRRMQRPPGNELG